ELIARLVLVGVLLNVGGFGLFALERSWGASDAEARTAAVAVIVFGEMGYLLNCRSLRTPIHRVPLLGNPWLYAGMATMAAFQLGFTYLPFMNALFHTAPLRAG